MPSGCRGTQMPREEYLRRKREYARKKYATPEYREAHAAYAREYRLKHPEKRRGYVRKSYDKNYGGRLLSKYGIDMAEFDRMLAAQGGVCAICGGLSGGRRFHVDHDHTTGAVRGLLCSSCNTAIGHLGDDPNRVAAAATYLASHMAML